MSGDGSDAFHSDGPDHSTYPVSSTRGPAEVVGCLVVWVLGRWPINCSWTACGLVVFFGFVVYVDFGLVIGLGPFSIYINNLEKKKKKLRSLFVSTTPPDLTPRSVF